jgi:ElaB/YqjD/DUF883 family membrane-anchored ribosome-binding protein
MTMANTPNGSTTQINTGEQLANAGSEVSRKATQVAEEARKESAKALQKAADRLRREVREGGGDDNAVKLTDDVASSLEKTALYLKETSVPEMEQELKERVQAQPFQALLVAFGVGLLVGLIVRGR